MDAPSAEEKSARPMLYDEVGRDAAEVPGRDHDAPMSMPGAAHALPPNPPPPVPPPLEVAAAGARKRCRPCSAGVNGRDGSASEARAAESVECSEPPLRRWCGSIEAREGLVSVASPKRPLSLRSWPKG